MYLDILREMGVFMLLGIFYLAWEVFMFDTLW
jgi:hypothetical protein